MPRPRETLAETAHSRARFLRDCRARDRACIPASCGIVLADHSAHLTGCRVACHDRGLLASTSCSAEGLSSPDGSLPFHRTTWRLPALTGKCRVRTRAL